MSTEIVTSLNGGREHRQLMALYRDQLPQSADCTGFPVLVGRELVLLARESDFALDGYVALRLDDITFVEQVDDMPFIRKLVTGERLYDNVKTPPLAGADSWLSLLGTVQSGFGGWLTVESNDEDGSCFFMGVISRIDSNYLYIRQVDADGSRHQEETTVPLQDIVTVTFGGRYVELYRKYCK